MFVPYHDRAVAGHQIEKFSIRFLLNSPLLTPMEAYVFIPQFLFRHFEIKGIHMYGDICSLNAGKDVIYRHNGITRIIGERIFFYVF